MTFDRKIYLPDDYPEQQQKVQKWKTDPSLHSCDRESNDLQSKKVLEYKTTYVQEFLNSDPIRDWESIERCIALWMFFMTEIGEVIIDVYKKKWRVLDCGTKDGQFPEWLSTQGIDALGTEISKDYVRYAKSKNRPVQFGDVCDMRDDWTDEFDVVFSHHLLGLTSDYWLAMSEMLRCTKPGGYMVTLNDVPGNPRKHYSLIENANIFGEFTKSKKVKAIFSGRWNQIDYPKEWVYIIQK